LETTRTSTAGTRASVKDDVVSLPCEGVSRRERRLDRSDAAAHLIDALDADEPRSVAATNSTPSRYRLRTPPTGERVGAMNALVAAA
jgi:hypothetical protein